MAEPDLTPLEFTKEWRQRIMAFYPPIAYSSASINFSGPLYSARVWPDGITGQLDSVSSEGDTLRQVLERAEIAAGEWIEKRKAFIIGEIVLTLQALHISRVSVTEEELWVEVKQKLGRTLSKDTYVLLLDDVIEHYTKMLKDLTGVDIPRPKVLVRANRVPEAVEEVEEDTDANLH
jgi:hypothetical protein